MTVQYLIDSENVGDFWIPLLELPADKSELIVFYTRNSPHMSYESLIRLKESDRTVTFIKCYEGTNALDFQLVSELGYLIGKNESGSFVASHNSAESFRSDGNKELLFGIYSAPNSLTITVDDSGPGIAPENLERVFERGFTTKGDGRGAGLYEVKRLVESLGGEISVRSAAGEGASFTVVFKGKGDAHV